MADGGEQVDLRFRIYDGTDIAHSTYPSSTTVATLKQKLFSEWPQDKTVIPESLNELKLIHAGKCLENNKTLLEAKATCAGLSAGVVTIHVVVQPAIARKNGEKDEMKKLNSCGCTIL